MNRPNKESPGGIFLQMKPREAGADSFDGHHFEVAATINGQVGSVVDATIDNRTGYYIIRVKHEAQAAKLLKLKKLSDGFAIRVERHVKLNSSKAIIRSKLVAETDDRKLFLELKNQKVTGVKSIPTDRRTKILTFSVATPPESIWIGLIETRTKTYYPMPKICRKCKRIGHTTEQCRGRGRCGRCSEDAENHAESTCGAEPHCANCLGNHQPLDKRCPVYLQERAVVKIQIDNKVNPKEARRRYMAESPVYHPLCSNMDTEGSSSGAVGKLKPRIDPFDPYNQTIPSAEPEVDSDIELVSVEEPESLTATPRPKAAKPERISPKEGPSTSTVAPAKRSSVGSSGAKKTPPAGSAKTAKPKKLSLTRRPSTAKSAKSGPKTGAKPADCVPATDDDSSGDEFIQPMTKP